MTQVEQTQQSVVLVAGYAVEGIRLRASRTVSPDPVRNNIHLREGSIGTDASSWAGSTSAWLRVRAGRSPWSVDAVYRRRHSSASRALSVQKPARGSGAVDYESGLTGVRCGPLVPATVLDSLPDNTYSVPFDYSVQTGSLGAEPDLEHRILLALVLFAPRSTPRRSGLSPHLSLQKIPLAKDATFH